MTSLAREGMTLDYLQDSPHVPRLISVEAGDDEYRITMEYINGQPFRDSFAVTPEWTCPAVSWEEARARLGSIAVAESDLLSRGGDV